MKLILLGTDGYIMEGILRSLLVCDGIEKVLLITRTQTQYTNAKLENLVVKSFLSIKEGNPQLEGYDAFLYLVNVSKKSVSLQKYHHYVLDVPLHLADVLPNTSQMKLIYFSEAGLKRNSTSRWAQMRAEAEDDLDMCGFKKVFHVRINYIKPSDDLLNASMSNLVKAWLYPVFHSFVASNTIQELDNTIHRLLFDDSLESQTIDVKDIKRFGTE